ncbi:cupin domain-containing protein [Halolamina sp. CBA1230]|uniref:cupin domain-containing protein n=1 Tax=Halolamina sp. CBA1230 TaxID=1853690 RepID=UPI0009A1A67C|nr:cupin domain-containing protein [Halolamina sp. CBA1230]QKY19846.1 cupin domain-containing protein [Halolamina sp. CBA1230]
MQTFASNDAPRKSLSDALGTTDVAINRYRLAPGEGLPSGLHTHLDQEEVFLVLDGTVTFETLSEPVVVDAGEAVRFAPGEYQTGANEGDSSATVLAVGAPKGSEAVRVPLDCPDCGHRGLSPEWRDGEALLACPDCGGEHRTRGCPACEREEMQVASGEDEGETVVVCPDCGAERATPRWT